MTDTKTPAARPANPRFSSGPCAKPPNFSLDRLADAALGREEIAALLAHYGPAHPDHPMTAVLREGLEPTAATPRRRGGWRSKRER